MAESPFRWAFVEEVSSILKAYFNGLYSEALRAATRAAGKYESAREYASAEWERSVISGLCCWMEHWDGLAAAKKFVSDDKNVSADPSALIRQLYTCLFAALVCCREARNPAALRQAEEAATLGSRLVGLVAPESFGFLDKRNTRFFPRPWTLYWFRALARTAAGARSAAREDFARAHDLLCSEYLPADAGRLANVATLIPLLCATQPIAGRFFHDIGAFLFEQGDWGYDPETKKDSQTGAKLYFDTARDIVDSDTDPAETNPYVLAGRALFYSIARSEEEAAKDLFEAFSMIEKRRARWREDNPGEPYCVSGRIFYQIGLLAYKYQHGEMSTSEEDDRAAALDAALSGMQGPEEDVKAFKEVFDDPANASGMFAESHISYLMIRNPFKSLPALIMLGDPLREGEGNQILARRLLWHLSYGIGSELVDSLINLENQVARYFVSDKADLSARAGP